MEFEATPQGFSKRILFYLRTLSAPANFLERKFDKELYLLQTQCYRYLERKALNILNVRLATPITTIALTK